MEEKRRERTLLGVRRSPGERPQQSSVQPARSHAFDASQPPPETAVQARLDSLDVGVAVSLSLPETLPPPDSEKLLSLPAPPPAARSPLLDLLGVGQEEPGRYTYRTSAGAASVELGRGGIGRVVVVTDEHLGREVALKELLPRLPDEPEDDRTTRFLAEARITGQLEHPNIVPVYEIGRRADGSLYYTMRIVRGETFATALERCNGLADRLALLPHFAGLCHALDYAHSRGVVHRDVKPDNVMIGEFGQTVVLDWGVAKVQGQSTGRRAPRPRGVDFLEETHHGDLVGTPLFMSPEQARGEVDEIDESSDIWALGVVLYILLSGKPPFQGHTLDEVLLRVEKGNRKAVEQLEPHAPPELCAVVERALHVDKRRRYASVRDLVRDVEAFMSGARVLAHSYSFWDHLARLYRRHRAATWVAVGAFLALIAVVTLLGRRIVAERDRALSLERVAREQSEQARRSLAEVFAERAVHSLSGGDLVAAELYAAQATSLSERADARGTLVALENRWPRVPSQRLEAFSKCRKVLTLGRSRLGCLLPEQLRWWSTQADIPHWVNTWPLPAGVAMTATSELGELIAAATQDGAVWLLSGASTIGQQVLAPRSALPTHLAVSDDGSRLALSYGGEQVEVWDTEQRSLVMTHGLKQTISYLRFSPRSHRLALGGRLGAVALLDETEQELLLTSGHRGTLLAIAFSPDGSRFVTAAADRKLSVWNAETGQRVGKPLAEVGDVRSVAFSPDGDEIAIGRADHVLGLWQHRSQEHPLWLRGHRGPVELVGYVGKNRLASYGPSDGIKLWSEPRKSSVSALAARANVLSQVFLSGQRLATAGLARSGVCIWNLSTGTCATRLPVRQGQVRALAVSSSEKHLALGTSEGSIVLWNLQTTLPEGVLRAHSGGLRSLEFVGPGANRLVSGATDSSVALWELPPAGQVDPQLSGAPARLVQRWQTHSEVQDLWVDSEGERVLVATRAGALEVFPLPALGAAAAERQRKAVPGAGDWMLSVVGHSPSKRLFTSDAQGRVLRWDLAKLEWEQQRSLHRGRAMTLALSPDGALLASAGEDGTVWLLNAPDLSARARLRHHRGTVRTLRFSPDGQLLTSGGDDGSVRVWDLQSLHRPADDLLERAQRRVEMRLEGARLVALSPSH